jgi:restriction endonuclease Mrr
VGRVGGVEAGGEAFAVAEHLDVAGFGDCLNRRVQDSQSVCRKRILPQLIDRVRQASLLFFEQPVVELLVAMGYGRSYADAANVAGKSGDGGIDGVIKEDRLGLESIDVQAKRWETAAGRPTIQQFAGALRGNPAQGRVDHDIQLLARSNRVCEDD